MTALALLPFAVVLFLLGRQGFAILVSEREKDRLHADRLHEREFLFKREEITRKESVGDDHAIPEDLVARINAWEDDFAKSDEERNIRVLYAELKDWDKVRRNLPSYAVSR
jgi:hypothetical protein